MPSPPSLTGDSNYGFGLSRSVLVWLSARPPNDPMAAIPPSHLSRDWTEWDHSPVSQSNSDRLNVVGRRALRVVGPSVRGTAGHQESCVSPCLHSACASSSGSSSSKKRMGRLYSTPLQFGPSTDRPTAQLFACLIRTEFTQNGSWRLCAVCLVT